MAAPPTRKKNLEASLQSFHRKLTGNYTGNMKKGRSEDSNGRYVFPNGTIFDGGFVDGEYAEICGMILRNSCILMTLIMQLL
jgi:hypothetical protein